MINTGSGLIQAVEWEPGRYGLATGSFSNIQLLSCLADGEVTAHFPTGDDTVTMTAGNDVALNGIDITIISGSFAIN